MLLLPIVCHIASDDSLHTPHYLSGASMAVMSSRISITSALTTHSPLTLDAVCQLCLCIRQERAVQQMRAERYRDGPVRARIMVRTLEWPDL